VSSPGEAGTCAKIDDAPEDHSANAAIVIANFDRPCIEIALPSERTRPGWHIRAPAHGRHPCPRHGKRPPRHRKKTSWYSDSSRPTVGGPLCGVETDAILLQALWNPHLSMQRMIGHL
jgi:hypothetical protein